MHNEATQPRDRNEATGPYGKVENSLGNSQYAGSKGIGSPAKQARAEIRPYSRCCLVLTTPCIWIIVATSKLVLRRLGTQTSESNHLALL